MLPAIFTYQLVWFVVDKIVSRERDDTMQNYSYFRVKGNDIVASYYIFYGIVVIPSILIFYCLCFALIGFFADGFSISQTFLYTFIFCIVLNVYMYICVVLSYYYFRFFKIFKVTFSLRVFRNKDKIEAFKELLDEKAVLNSELSELISLYPKEFSKFNSHLIIRRSHIFKTDDSIGDQLIELN